jgi:hypothetical protein
MSTVEIKKYKLNSSLTVDSLKFIVKQMLKENINGLTIGELCKKLYEVPVRLDEENERYYTVKKKQMMRACSALVDINHIKLHKEPSYCGKVKIGHKKVYKSIN